MAEDSDDRTLPATQRRIDKARGEGHVPISREVASLAGLGGAALVLIVVGPTLATNLAKTLGATLSASDTLEAIPALRGALLAGLLFVGPLTLAVLATSVASSLFQTGLVMRPSALMPDLSRLDPRRGLGRIFGIGGLVEQVKALAKFSVLGLAAWHVITGLLPLLQGAVLWLPEQLAGHLLREMLRLLLMLLAVQTVIAAADVAWMRYRHFSGLRMSRDEVKQDGKEADGNPHMKGRLRQMRQSRAKQRMMAAVPTATVVVTNPTHYAIALAYDRRGAGAPRVVAKGVDEVAARIREAAHDSRVPIVSNPPLARALYTVKLDAEIPAEHFKAVAEIIAYVWRLRGRPR